MTVAVMFEASGIVRDALLRHGIDAVSIDRRPTDRPGPHIQGDVFDHLDGWGGAIMHPECTYLTGSGLHWNYRVHGRAACTEWAIQLVKRLMKMPYPFAIENPVGCIGTRIRKHDQIIQPYEFGDDASKKTCLWLHRLPPLEKHPGQRIFGRVVLDPNTGKIVERWSNQTDSGQNKLPPSEDRWAIRSETYPGIADAFAEQWASYFRNPIPADLFEAAA